MKTIRNFVTTIAIGITSSLRGIQALATDFKPEDLKNHNNHVFDSVENVVVDTGGYALYLGQKILIVLMVVFIMMAAGGWMFWHSNAQRRDEQKIGIIVIIVAGCVGFGATLIVGLVYGFFVE